ncbi:tetratricopeptide repeat protein [Mucilaginibacter angelicae]|uniref:Tetratricopeptide repeat protein n=1 Tax=Mucilaginibacter angelicae TaxID=869718 RepID=A0ABV6L3A1_9SPHI
MNKPFVVLLIGLLITCAFYAHGQAIDYEKMGDSLVNAKNYDKAAESYSKAINANKRNKALLPKLYDNHAQCQIELKNFTDAVDDDNEAIKIDSLYADAYWNRAAAYFFSGHVRESIADYSKAILLFPGDKLRLSLLYDNIGVNEIALQNYELAIDNFNSSITANGQNGAAYWHRAIAYNALGNYQQAVDDYSTATFFFQDNLALLAKIYNSRALAREKINKSWDAINDLSMAIQLKPSDPDLYWRRGLAYEKHGDYQLAIDDYKHLIPIYINDKLNAALLYENCAVNENNLHQTAKAFSDVNKAIELFPQRGHLYWIRGVAYGDSGECARAIDDYNKALPFYKNDKTTLAIFYNNIAANEFIINQNKKALNHCNAAIELLPIFWQPVFTRARLYLKLNEKELALKDFNKVMALDPTKQSAEYVFAQFYTGNAGLAVSTMQKKFLASSNIDLPADYYTMACLLSLMNRAAESNIYLKKALDLGYLKKFVALDDRLDNIRKTDDYIAIMTEPTIKKAAGQ